MNIRILSCFIFLWLSALTVSCAVQNPSASDFYLVPDIKGCARGEEGDGSRSLKSGGDQEPAIEVVGSTIKYSREIDHMCCREVKFEKSIKGATITLYEVWSGEGCRCMCFSEISASVENVPAGKYTVLVYAKGTTTDGKPMDESLIISSSVVIFPLSTKSLSYSMPIEGFGGRMNKPVTDTRPRLARWVWVCT